MIKNVKIRILAFFMALTLSFCVCANQYNEVKALEWVAPVVGLDTALKALLGLLGISASVGLVSQIDWSDLQDDCVQYQIQKGNDAVAVGRWWDKVISGGLDTASSCWDSFKDWVSNKLLSSGGTSQPLPVQGSVSEIIHSLVPYSYGTIAENLDFQASIGFYGLYKTENRYMVLLLPNDFSLNQLDSTFVYYTSNNDVRYGFFNIAPSGSINTQAQFNRNYASYNFTNDADWFFLNSGYTNSELEAINPNFHVWTGTSVDLPSDFDSAVSDLGTIGLAPDVATDLPYDGVIDIPWENVGATDTAIDDAFDDALDKVNTGAWTLDQYWTWVQNVTNVFAYDTTNNYLLPNDGDDEKADDKVQQNINRGAMVLYGLEKVFPFCIPWDIYAFVNLLVADPVAPVIEYPIYNPVSGEDETIIIDFSVWESQVILMRYIQDFLLIIGLLLLARSLIGAGGSD